MLNTRKVFSFNKEMLLIVFALAWPSIIEQGLQAIVQYADYSIVGSLGAQASAAVGLTTTVTWLINGPLFAMGIGVLAYIAASIGAKKYDKAKLAAVQAIIITFILGVILTVITLAVSPFLPKWLGAEPEIQREASLFFGIICIPMIFRASTIIFGAVLRATGDMKTPMKVNLVMNVVNVALNFLLVFDSRSISLGSLSLPIYGAGWGVVGSAIATAVSYCVSGTLMFIALYRNEMVSPKGERIKLNKPIMQRCIEVGFPVTLERLTTSFGQVVFTTLVTKLGTLALAAHSIAITAEQAFYIPGFGMQSSASTLAGHALGEKDEKKLHNVAVTIMQMTVAVMTLTGAVLFIFPDFMMSIFTKDPTVIKSGASALRIVAVSEPMYGALIILAGIFNGVGDTKAPFLFPCLVCGV
jgi:putative MATE family efflux protein